VQEDDKISTVSTVAKERLLETLQAEKKLSVLVICKVWRTVITL
jgi:hypothetical protein